jgi:ribonucleoside-diphosphate reductase alpha chain
VEFADESMEIISYYAILASTELSKERGTYETFKGSKWDRGLLPIDTIALLESERESEIEVDRTSRLNWGVVRDAIKEYGMRNSNTMAIAPTATIANISGCIPSIEPIYKNIYVKSNISGDFTVVNPYLVDELKKEALWDDEILNKIKYHDGSISKIPEIPLTIKEKYKEVFEIDMNWLLKAAAYRGKWIDQSQSLNIFFKGSSGSELSTIYMRAWELGLKTTYYLRTLAASQVEKSTVKAEEVGATHKRGDVEGKENIPATTPKTEVAEVQSTPHVSPIRIPQQAPATSVAQVAVASVVSNVSVPANVYIEEDAICEACE